MSDGIMLVLGEDGVAREYDDTWDITIHCESEEEQKAVCEKLNNLNREVKDLTDTISRHAAISAVISLCDDCDSDYCGSCRVNFPGEKDCRKVLEDLPPAQKKEYTKADYIMALHKEYGCSLARAEEAHRKALEYLRNTSMIKG